MLSTAFVPQVGGTQLGLIVLAVSSLLIALAIAFASSWKLTLVILLFIPFVMGAGFIYGRNLQGSAKRMTAAVEEGDKVCDGSRMFGVEGMFECANANNYSS